MCVRNAHAAERSTGGRRGEGGIGSFCNVAIIGAEEFALEFARLFRVRHAGRRAEAGGRGREGGGELLDAAHIRVAVGRRRSSGAAAADAAAADNVGGISRRTYCADSVSRGLSPLRRAENFRTLAVRGRTFARCSGKSDEKSAPIGGIRKKLETAT